MDGGSTATYVYDAMGNRVQRTVGGSSANYLYDLDGNITSDLLPSGSDAADYIFAGGQLVDRICQWDHRFHSHQPSGNAQRGNQPLRQLD